MEEYRTPSPTNQTYSVTKRHMVAASGRNRRKWAPRVRTGCQTCRTRKLKCDEAKPACERCTSGGYSCLGLGYGSSDLHVVVRQKRQSPYLARSPSAVPQLSGSSEARDLIIIGPLMESRLFYPSTEHPGDAKTNFLVGRMKRLSSYIYHIPQRTGRSSTLDNAVACTATALRILYATNDLVSDPSAWYLYGEALRGLRCDLQHSERSMMPETLCATELLSYFESLVSDDRHVVLKHSQGSMQLIQHRGPKKIASEFEKSLFAPQVMNITMKALMEGRHCYLGLEPWVSALRDSISLDPMNHPDRSEVKISYGELVIWVTNLAKSCTDLFLAKKQNSTNALHTRREQLLVSAYKYRDALYRWAQRWDSDLYKAPTGTERDAAAKLGQGDVQLSISFKTAIIVSCRFPCALGSLQGLALEMEAQATAQALLDELQHPLIQNGSVNDGICRPIAEAILKTSEDWLAFCKTQPESDAEDSFKLIPSETYFRWISLTGIQLPAGYNDQK